MTKRFTQKIKPFWRINERIQASKVRVISSDGKQLGIFSAHEALERAKKEGLDLVEIAPKATPPVTKIIDFAKFRYQEAKKQKEAALKEKRGSEQKEVWFTPFIGDSDYIIRFGKTRDFLSGGQKVRIVIKFKGPQMAHKEFGYKLADKLKFDTQDIAEIDQKPKFLGKQLVMVFTPVKRKYEKESKTKN